jgi:hypothetical protein
MIYYRKNFSSGGPKLIAVQSKEFNLYAQQFRNSNNR